MNSRKITHRLKKKITTIDPEVEIYLFGSRARGDFRNDSDWDVLVLTERELNYKLENKIRSIIFEIELEVEEPISTLIYSKKEWMELEVTPLYQNIKSEGVRA